MSTKAYYPISEIGKGKVGFSKTRSIIEGAFYGNNVVKVNTLREAYELAKNSPGTIVTDMPVYRGEEFGLDKDAKVLLFNDGAITGRYATARRIAGEPGVDCEALDKVAMDAIYESRWKTMYHAEVFVGLDPEFMVKAHLLIPEGEENIMYNWMLNFQYMSDEYVKMYKKSKPVGDGKEPDIYIFSGTPEGAPDKDEYVELEFVEGVPVAVNGKKMEPVELLTTLNEIGKRNGIGIADMVENRLVGMKDRGVYETPGGTIIYYAHNELENICLDRATYNYKEQIGIRYAELVYDGMWFSQLREALQAFVDETQKTVTGTVRLKLYKGNIISAGTTSPYSLYSKEYVTFGEDDVYDQTDAKGFITLFGLPLTVRALMKQGKLK